MGPNLRILDSSLGYRLYYVEIIIQENVKFLIDHVVNNADYYLNLFLIVENLLYESEGRKTNVIRSTYKDQKKG